MSWRRAVLRAPGRTLAAGWIPADAAGTALIAFHRAAVSWDRAEFAVHTNTTRGTLIVTGRELAVTARLRGGPQGLIAKTELDIAAPPIAFGPDPTDDAGILQDIQVMGQYIAARPGGLGQLAGRGIAGDQAVDDRQSHQIAQRSVSAARRSIGLNVPPSLLSQVILS
jgi:hypothetical protein